MTASWMVSPAPRAGAASRSRAQGRRTPMRDRFGAADEQPRVGVAVLTRRQGRLDRLGGNELPVGRVPIPSLLIQPIQTADFAVSFQIVPRLRSYWITTDERGRHVR
jgi:hypothetical protein